MTAAYVRVVRTEEALRSVSAPSPWHGLRHFEAAERDKFYGRAAEIQRLVGRVTSGRFTLLYGPSGAGKTSLLLAGLLPALRDAGFLTVYVRPRGDPEKDLREALASAAGLEQSPSREALFQAMSERGRPWIVAVDQLEEIFLRFDAAARKRFFDALFDVWGCGSPGGALRPNPRFALRGAPGAPRLLLSLRQEFLGDLEEEAELAAPEALFNARGCGSPDGALRPEPLDGRFRLTRPDRANAREVVVRTLRDADIDVSSAFLDGFLGILEKDCFDPVLIQLYGVELHRHLAEQAADDEPPALDEDHLTALKDPATLFRRFLQRGISAALAGEGAGDLAAWTSAMLRAPEAAKASPQQGSAIALRALLDGLTTSARTRRPATLAELCEGRCIVDAEKARRLLDRLAAENLLRSQVLGEDVWYELVHDRLAEVVDKWVRSDPEYASLRLVGDVLSTLAESATWENAPRLFLSKDHLDVLLVGFRDELRFSEAEEDLVLKSAVKTRHPDLASWSKRVGAARSEAILSILVKDADADTRSAAWDAAPVLASESATLRAESLETSLSDPKESVRNAASKALAKWATEGDVKALKRETESGERAEAANEVILAFVAEKRSLKPVFSDAEVSAAEGRLIARLASQSKETTALHEKVGAYRGLVSGLTWSLCIALPLAFGADALYLIGRNLVAEILGAALMLSAVLGVALGLFLARARAEARISEAAGRRAPTWISLILRARTAVPIAVVSGLCPMLSLKLSSGIDEEIEDASGVLAAVLAPVAVALIAGLAERARRVGARWLLVTMASSGAALGVAFLTGLPLLLAVPRAHIAFAEQAIWAWMLALSCVATLAIGGLTRDEASPAVEVAGPRRPNVPLALLLGLALVPVLSLSFLVRRGQFRWSAAELDVSRLEEPAIFPTRRGFPRWEHHLLRNRTQDIAIVRVIPERAEVFARESLGSPLYQESFLLVPPGLHDVVFKGSPESNGQVTFLRESPINGSLPFTLPAQSEVRLPGELVRLTLRPSADSRWWEGELRQRASSTRSVLLTGTILAFAPAGPGGWVSDDAHTWTFTEPGRDAPLALACGFPRSFSRIGPGTDGHFSTRFEVVAPPADQGPIESVYTWIVVVQQDN